MTPTFHNITEILEDAGQSDLVKFMNRYWIANQYAPSSEYHVSTQLTPAKQRAELSPLGA